MATKPCPKCGSPAHKEREGRDQAKHGVHGATHVAASHPLGALFMLGMSGLYATGLLDKYRCSRCGHRF